ncbi:hypothetical protein S7711_02581 [Stachybotrys chartarum IBT 7711]|uniref:Rhodopsin domain-containing protein n=1 Tax=Stachybotrys chartarum (strain CBS 109288 / IBT 7711) TaxID=1280523 RepID=A0A084B8V7_STACB|nr:hypothetical protein S7711_02581 [Stachybotrys chartarum IBT 7711]KFA56132.1 hypothetical protein S40293_00197 [Stachybotrys chartarum IBT 40293]KFA72095.1 hypothetical protein S40288_02249 [Stachybotrys chartarum IBT 40288]
MDGETVIRTETQGPLLLGVAIGFVVASAVVLALRLYTRVWLIQTPGADDWTIVLAMYLYVAVLHYNVGMNVVKISFLFQYRRIFATQQVQTICFWALIGVVFWACLQAVLLGISCLPISFIVPSTADWCLDTLPVWYFSSAMSLATDILIFCIPLPSVLKLQLPIKQKVLVMFIFSLGFFVCIISVYRIWTLRDAVFSEDPPWDNVGAAMWSAIELNCAIICASLPTLRPLISKIVPGLSSIRSTGRDTYERYGSQYAGGSSSRHLSRGARIKDATSGPRSISTEELALNDMPAVYIESDGPSPKMSDLKHIVVTTETSVKMEPRHQDV